MLRWLTTLLLSSALSSARYLPTWDSLDSRPNPSWYDEAKVGIFIHQGVFSVPSFHGEWFWSDLVSAKLPDVVQFVEATEAPGFHYPDYAPRLSYEFFNATEWLELFVASGAKYIVPTTKHHEGFTMSVAPQSKQRLLPSAAHPLTTLNHCCVAPLTPPPHPQVALCCLLQLERLERGPSQGCVWGAGQCNQGCRPAARRLPQPVR